MSECKEIITKQVMSECKEIIQNKLCLNVKKSYKTSYV